MSLVKICGVNTGAAFDAVVEAGADFVGFVFFPSSPRHVTGMEAKLLSERHMNGPKRVGVFVNPGLNEVDGVLQYISLDILQVHGAPELIATLKHRFGRPVWRQVGAEDEVDFPALDEAADAFIVEAKPPRNASRPGGNAIRADWSLLSRFRPEKPWLLAGGLTAGNVAEGLRRTGAHGADVSSGVETAPGQKDPALIRAFVAAVRGM